MTVPYEKASINVERAYALARSGRWDAVLESWACDRALLVACSRYRRPGSLWTFLHQAAHFGQEPAIRVLIAAGASTAAEGDTPAQAARRRGHFRIADLLDHAARGAEGLWQAPSDPGFLPSSSLFEEARERTANANMIIAYGGGRVSIPAGQRHHTDSFDRVLVGWHGTYDPPRTTGMEDISLAEQRV